MSLLSTDGCCGRGCCRDAAAVFVLLLLLFAGTEAAAGTEDRFAGGRAGGECCCCGLAREPPREAGRAAPDAVDPLRERMAVRCASSPYCTSCVHSGADDAADECAEEAREDAADALALL